MIREIGSERSKKFGRIFYGKSKLNGQSVIIKHVSKQQGSAAFTQLRNEIQFNFTQPGLPHIIDYFETETECFLVRNYLEGETLSTHWKQQSRKEKIPFLIHLLKSLKPLFTELSAHHRVHCDLKPSNIIIQKTAENQIKTGIIDFGLGVHTAQPAQRKIIFPLGFAAPELLLNHLDLVDHRTDQFALGISIWFLYVGQLPLSHPNPSIFTNLQLTHPLPDHSALPKGLFPILQKMTNKHSFRTSPTLMDTHVVKSQLKQGIENRFASFDEVISAFQALELKKSYRFGF